MELAGVVLAAGAGTRLRPLTTLRPKALCPVANRPLLDWALDRVRPHAGAVAVNVHHHRGQLLDHLAGHDPDVHVSDEQPVALGTAGALGRLRGWLDGRHVLLANADAWSPSGLDPLLDGWTGELPRLQCVRVDGPADFDGLRYVGAALLPWSSVRDLAPEPSGLYEVSWRDAYAAGRLELVVDESGLHVDCGTPAEYLRANLLARGGAAVVAEGAVVDGEVVASVVGAGAVVSGEVVGSIVGEGAVVEGGVVRSVVWPGARVSREERVVDAIRADGLTVPADGGLPPPPPRPKHGPTPGGATPAAE